MQAVKLPLAEFTGLRAYSSLQTRPSAAVSTPRAGLRRPAIQAALAPQERREKRHLRLRNKVEGRAERPRLSVYRSNNHIYAQVIDDTAGSTLAAASTLTPEIRGALNGSKGGNKDGATLVGKKIAELCLAKNIDKVCFDRGGNLYHGRIQALAEAAREGGLNF